MTTFGAETSIFTHLSHILNLLTPSATQPPENVNLRMLTVWTVNSSRLGFLLPLGILIQNPQLTPLCDGLESECNKTVPFSLLICSLLGVYV